MSSVRIEISCLSNSRGELIRHLIIDNLIFMSNTDDEYEDIDRTLKTAVGNCFIGGLGLGLIANACCQLEKVKAVTVVENNQEVIDLFLKNNKIHEKLHIFYGNCLTDFNWGYSPYNWFYQDFYIEPSDFVYKQIKDSYKLASPFLSQNCILEGWLLSRMIEEYK